MEKINELNKKRIEAISKLNKQIEKINYNYIKAITTFRKGDEIEFIEKGDSYNWEPDNYHRGKIYAFKISHDGSIYVGVSGIHYEPRLINIRLFNPDDFTLRNQLNEDES